MGTGEGMKDGKTRAAAAPENMIRKYRKRDAAPGAFVLINFNIL